ncbi:extracellular solute-binding protein [Ruminococcaceae bacterium YRB3002]|nr:extracellular solute-binding protein [Ruminococcaceae bacterium YRB3002]
MAVIMIVPLVFGACGKDEDVTLPDTVPDGSLWYDTKTIVMGKEFDTGRSDYRAAYCLGELDGKYYYAVKDHDNEKGQYISKVIGYDSDGKITDTYDVAQMRSGVSYFYYARIVDGEIILRFYDGDVMIDRSAHKCVELNHNDYSSDNDDFAGSDSYDGLRFDRYFRSGPSANTTVYKVWKDGEQVKTVDLYEYLHDTELTSVEPLIRLDEHKYLIIRSEIYNQAYYEWDYEADTIKDVSSSYSWLNTLRDVRFSSCDSGVYALDVNAVYKIDLSAKRYDKIASSMNFAIPLIDRGMVIKDVTEDNIIIETDNSYFNSYETVKKVHILTKAGSNPHANARIIRVASEREDFCSGFAELVARYNESQSDNYIVVDDRYYLKNFYGNYVDVRDTGTTFYFDAEKDVGDKLLVDLKAGDGPDILLNSTGEIALMRDDCLEDLNPYIDGNNGIDRNKLFDNVLRASEYKGKLYNIPLSFELDLIATVSDAVKEDQSGFTVEEYGAFVKDQMSGEDLVLNGARGKDEFVNSLIVGFLADLISDDGIIEFGNREFTDIVEYAMDNQLKPRPEDKWTDNTANRFYITNLWDILEYCGYAGWNIRDVHLLGLPGYTEHGPDITCSASVAIASSAQDKQACWDFVRFLLSDEGQMIFNDARERETGHGGCNCINRSVFEMACMNMIDGYNQECDNNITNNPGADYRTSGIPYIKADRTDVERYTSLVESLDRAINSDPQIQLIVAEELPAFFDGSKSLDETIEVMNRRSQIVLDERR